MNYLAIGMLALTLGACTPFVTEFADSSGCMWTKGGPMGVTFGEVLVCRSGKDNAKVYYEDNDRSITIDHTGQDN